jgi:hypothetical protein
MLEEHFIRGPARWAPRSRNFIPFLYVAEGSLFEALTGTIKNNISFPGSHTLWAVSFTLTEIFIRRGLFKEQDATEIRRKAEVIDRKLQGLINSLRNRSKN